jgi:hypothetical protein
VIFVIINAVARVDKIPPRVRTCDFNFAAVVFNDVCADSESVPVALDFRTVLAVNELGCTLIFILVSSRET